MLRSETSETRHSRSSGSSGTSAGSPWTASSGLPSTTKSPTGPSTSTRTPAARAALTRGTTSMRSRYPLRGAERTCGPARSGSSGRSRGQSECCPSVRSVRQSCAVRWRMLATPTEVVMRWMKARNIATATSTSR